MVAGGGVCDHGAEQYYGTATPGSENGGAGGTSKRNNFNLGGAGNPGVDKGENGTGGLLILVAKDIENNGVISAKGSNGGGSSGGGSINIFYTGSWIMNEEAKINADGGYGSGTGGTGAISIGKIANGIYNSTYTNY